MRALIIWIIFAVFVTPAVAQDAKGALNAAVAIRFYRDQCPGGEAADAISAKWTQDFIKISGKSEQEARRMIEGGLTLMGAVASDEAKKQQVCEAMSAEVVAFNKANGGSYAERFLGKRASIFVELIIVGAIGAFVGLLVGLIGWGITRRNPLKLGWWMPVWIIGAIGFSRVIVPLLSGG